MLGMIPGNGHPYSWSAIINGYDRDAMASCPYAGIPAYLGAQPHEKVRVPGVQVTHLWTDDPAEAPLVAKASLIPHVVARPEDVIGKVDAVLISTDDGNDHVRRARPFVEAGLPVFIDKPMATTAEDLRTFVEWQRAGRRILSSSGMRYQPELDTLIQNLPAFGDLRWICFVTAKTWDRYGIHVLEPVFRILGPGFLSVRLETQPGLEIAHVLHRSGVQVTLPVIYDGGAAFGTGQVVGTKSQSAVKFTDTYNAFRRQLVSYIDFVRSGTPPFPFAHTVEMMAVIIAGIRSRQENSRRVEVAEILSQLPS
ncbi:MAG: oxidoreductase [Verrucomicrobia bacterium]|nr:oxidoreductase [Verrucomicrobiota bacterium]